MQHGEAPLGDPQKRGEKVEVSHDWLEDAVVTTAPPPGQRHPVRMTVQSVETTVSLLQTWLSEVEGKQNSRGDRRHSADNHHHTPQGRER